MLTSRSVSLRIRNVSDKFAEVIKTHSSCSTIFFPENRAVYEIMWKNNVEPGRPQKTTWRMPIVCQIPKATNSHSEYAILIASPQPLLGERASILYAQLPVLLNESMSTPPHIPITLIDKQEINKKT